MTSSTFHYSKLENNTFDPRISQMSKVSSTSHPVPNVGSASNLNIPQTNGMGISSSPLTSDIADMEVESFPSWNRWGLCLAYIALYMMAFATSLEVQTTSNLTAFAISSFKSHSMVSTVAVTQGIVNSVIKPPMSKIADYFGRLEAFTLAVTLYTLGYIQLASSKSVQAYAAAQICYSAGNQGLQILQQIFIADTTSLSNRALASSIPYLPFIVCVWIGPVLANRILGRNIHDSWRWGYGMWAIILPTVFIPLACALFLHERKGKRQQKNNLAASINCSESPPSLLAYFKKGNFFQMCRDIDLIGILLLSTGIALILLPLTLVESSKNGWKSVKFPAMLTSGVIVTVIFFLWENNPKFSGKRAFFPRGEFSQRTVLAGLGVGFFYFQAFYLSVYPYFFSYLLVVQNKSVTTAGLITQSFSFSAVIASVLVSLVIKWTGRYKIFIILGASVYMVGLGLMFIVRREHTAILALFGSQIVLGIGGGVLNLPTQLGVQASVTRSSVSSATTLFLTVMELGGATGSAISGAVWSAFVPRRLKAYLPEESKHFASSIYGNVTMASQKWPVGTPERIAINHAYQDAMNKLLIVALCAAAPVLPFCLMMKEYRFNRRDNDEQVYEPVNN